MKLDYTELGKRIKKLRQEKDIPQHQIAEEVGIEPSNISHIERAVTKPSLATLVGIANALGVTLDDLVCDSLPAERYVFYGEAVDTLKDCNPYELRVLIDSLKALKETLRARKNIMGEPDPREPKDKKY